MGKDIVVPKKKTFKLHVLQSASVRSESKSIATPEEIENEIDTLIDYLVQIAVSTAVSAQGGCYR
jgi:hypothetical protein